MFPEGEVHTGPSILPLKTGAARIVLGAAADAEVHGVEVVPVLNKMDLPQADPETAKRLRSMGLEPPAMTLEQSQQFWLQERDQWHAIVRRLNLKLD